MKHLGALVLSWPGCSILVGSIVKQYMYNTLERYFSMSWDLLYNSLLEYGCSTGFLKDDLSFGVLMIVVESFKNPP